MGKDYARETHLVLVETEDSALWLPGFSSSIAALRPSDRDRRNFPLTSLLAIVFSALLAGTLDIAATGSLMRAQGTPFRRLLQFVASGALGPSAFEGGVGTAIAGLALHFGVAGIWAVIYFTFVDRWPGLSARPVLSGALYGVAFRVVRSRIVVPLSRAAK